MLTLCVAVCLQVMAAVETRELAHRLVQSEQQNAALLSERAALVELTRALSAKVTDLSQRTATLQAQVDTLTTARARLAVERHHCRRRYRHPAAPRCPHRRVVSARQQAASAASRAGLTADHRSGPVQRPHHHAPQRSASLSRARPRVYRPGLVRICRRRRHC